MTVLARSLPAPPQALPLRSQTSNQGDPETDLKRPSEGSRESSQRLRPSPSPFLVSQGMTAERPSVMPGAGAEVSSAKSISSKGALGSLAATLGHLLGNKDKAGGHSSDRNSGIMSPQRWVRAGTRLSWALVRCCAGAGLELREGCRERRGSHRGSP